MREALLKIVGISKHFDGLWALRDVSFDVFPNEVVSVIGPNGAGKTTLFNCLTKYLDPDEGRIFFEGKDITGYETHEINETGIARTFQQIRLFYNLTVLENVLIGMHARTRAHLLDALWKPRWVLQEEKSSVNKAKEILSLFQRRLITRLDQKANMLSYANRRRLEIARALASQPKLLLLDEPVAGMNPHETQLIIELIKILSQGGITILLIEHNMKLVMSISDRVIVLDHGEKIAEGTPKEIQKDSKVLEAYMGKAASHVGA